MDFQKVLGASPAMQLIDVLSDDHDPSALLTQPGLTFGNGKVPRVWLLAEHDLPPIMVELPHQGRVSCKGLSLPFSPVAPSSSQSRDSALSTNASP